MTGPSLRAVRRAVTVALVALLFGVGLVSVAGSSRTSAEVPVASDPVAHPAGSASGGSDVHLGSAPRASDGSHGLRPAAVRAAGERAPARVALVATAAALAALLAALAAVGGARVPGVERLRRFGAPPLGARAPPASRAA